MLIVGTGGLARDVITSWEIDEENNEKELFLFDNIKVDTEFLYGKYKILHTYEEVKSLFNKGNKAFFVCIGNPLKRKRITETFEQLGGQLVPFVSCRASIVSPFMPLSGGVVIEPAVVVSKDVILEKGVFVNAGAIIGHDAILHEYVSLGPGVRILGNVEIGEYCLISAGLNMSNVKVGNNTFIGIGATIKPGVELSENTTIGIGAVLLQNTEKDGVYIGSPAKIYKKPE